MSRKIGINQRIYNKCLLAYNGQKAPYSLKPVDMKKFLILVLTLILGCDIPLKIGTTHYNFAETSTPIETLQEQVRSHCKKGQSCQSILLKPGSEIPRQYPVSDIDNFLVVYIYRQDKEPNELLLWNCKYFPKAPRCLYLLTLNKRMQRHSRPQSPGVGF